MVNLNTITPLFIMAEGTDNIGKNIVKFAHDDYNKELGAALIDAKNDADAISIFLSEYKDSVETLRSYAKEVERLLLWCIHVAKVNISSLRRDHLTNYQDFLKNPSPKKLWCGPSIGRLKKDGTLNSDWRPFVRGLGANSIKKSIKILDSFFNYLVQTNYLVGNPLAVNRRRKRRNQAKPRIIDRYLELDEIHATLNALSEYPTDDDTKAFQAIRARYIILLLFYSGLRIAEAANHSMGNFMQREGNWFLRVIGKGKKLREIPVPDELREALANFREKVSLPTPQPKFRKNTPLIPMQNLKQSIRPRRIDQILKWAFNLGANQFEPDHPQKASKLRQASAHWLRHSYVTYLLDSGAPLKVAQENAGHSDIGTTMLYRHVAQTDRFEATRHLSLRKIKSSSKN
ncbi:MAG: tyrosine-type recombinase/integrase [Gammaproteobacteria bacterium]|nr:tyrosine-type recombinase/integrase [Gammaproteobacteria bacterium]